MVVESPVVVQAGIKIEGSVVVSVYAALTYVLGTFLKEAGYEESRVVGVHRSLVNTIVVRSKRVGIRGLTVGFYVDESGCGQALCDEIQFLVEPE